ncbi:MAG TPA: hypothetical protein VFX12_07230 [Vicinamibacterales bacterium]|nr:hypothetical protein [Vicinamibacterales bacterium]
MVNRSRPTQSKRARERAQTEKRNQKLAKREESKQRRANTHRVDTGEDPDIAGIIPGPQPSPYGDEFLDDVPADDAVEE